MKNDELIKLKKDYKKEIYRLNEIKELVSIGYVKKFASLIDLNLDEYSYIDNYKVLSKLLLDRKITQTNGIYVCVGTFSTSKIKENTIGKKEKEMDFDSKKIQYRKYCNIENLKVIKAFIDAKYTSEYDTKRITKQFENENIVLNPYNTNENMNGFNEVRQEFFMECINSNQKNAKNLILKKYNRI